jgi:predicted lactoylglutathione lyase
MTIPPRINLITLGVSDVERSTAFYESLGWTKSDQSVEGTTFIQLGVNVLSLYPHDKLAEDATVQPGERQRFPGFTLAINTDSPEEVDDIINSARDVGAKIIKEPHKVFWGGYSGYFSDPDGFLWEVAHNPFFPKDENGYVKI